jgi:hypothetical protein
MNGTKLTLPIWVIVDEAGQQRSELGNLLHLFTDKGFAERLASGSPLTGSRVCELATPVAVRELVQVFEQAGGAYVSIDSRTPEGSEGRIRLARELLDGLASEAT